MAQSSSPRHSLRHTEPDARAPHIDSSTFAQLTPAPSAEQSVLSVHARVQTPHEHAPPPLQSLLAEHGLSQLVFVPTEGLPS
jgi:hypothetical protein